MEKELDVQTETMLARYSVISPLLTEGLEAAEKRRRRNVIIQGEIMSERTLRRFLEAYRMKGLEGLRPKLRSDRGARRALPDEIYEQAAALKEELPQRSVSRILDILEGEKQIQPGQIARSTLSRHLAKEGLTERTASSTGKSRRFQKEHRNTLWQTDVKYGPYISHPTDPKRKIRTYLLLFIDDATRLICHGEFYADQKLPILEDCFRKALLKRGLPENIYVDNGKIFVSRWFRYACARMNIRHMTTQPYSPESKGKIERLNRTVEEFLGEISLEKPKTLEELNQCFSLWVEAGYNHKKHSSLNGMTPAERFNGDEKRLRFIRYEECKESFLWEESRRVDKTGCIKLRGKEYEVGIEWIKKTVDARYDPFDLMQIEIWVQGEKKGIAKQLTLHEYNGINRSATSNPKDIVEIQEAKSSRLLQVLASKEKARIASKIGAIAYRQLNQRGDEHV
ncbi:Integrase, catalytic region [Candidatus Desulfosporosinus infrequens]|uniref:Integrase, catalytic region n=1 Tax=Candidatus Desulfosporosinus infrequens TaxID=2043169 RepID=A0A2U3L633_9FIRM|nr:Integrase, catalytic region [Candidatus Desulfosporosinus infrequens]